MKRRVAKKTKKQAPLREQFGIENVRHKILVVDDSDDERSVLGDLLKAEGFSVISAQSALDGFAAAVDGAPDMILSDVSMPTEDGMTFVRRLRGDARTAAIPVLLMSGSNTSIEDQAEGHDLGADDYVTKPYSHKLLVSKIHSAIRRRFSEQMHQSLEVVGINIDFSARLASLKGVPLKLTRKEFDLLTTFLRKPERVLSIPFLLETVWGYDPAQYNDPATVHSHVSSLRRKIGKAAGDRIVSVPALGYRFTP